MGRPHRTLSRPAAGMICVLALCQAGCSVLPAASSSVPAVPPVNPPAGSGPAALPSASATLLAQSRTARLAGNFAAAAAALDRALRIEPNNPTVWLEYAELRMAEGNTEQAATLARKASSLAGDDRTLRSAAAELIRTAGE